MRWTDDKRLKRNKDLGWCHWLNVPSPTCAPPMATFLSFSTTRHVDCSDLIMRFFFKGHCFFPLCSMVLVSGVGTQWALPRSHSHSQADHAQERQHGSEVAVPESLSKSQQQQKLTSSSTGLRITGTRTRTSQCWCFPRVIPLSVSQMASSLSRHVLLPWIMSLSKIIPRWPCPTTTWEAGPRGWPSCRWLWSWSSSSPSPATSSAWSASQGSGEASKQVGLLSVLPNLSVVCQNSFQPFSIIYDCRCSRMFAYLNCVSGFLLWWCRQHGFIHRSRKAEVGSSRGRWRRPGGFNLPLPSSSPWPHYLVMECLIAITHHCSLCKREPIL